MKPEVTRRVVLDRLKSGLAERGFDDVSTRRGKLDQTFHIDGKQIIGRGTVSRDVVSVEMLQIIHDEVYTLGRMKDKYRVHLTYGSYSQNAVKYAESHRIHLYTFDRNGRLSSLSSSTAAQGAKELGRFLLWFLLLAAVVTGVFAGIVWLVKSWNGAAIGAGIEVVLFILAGIVVLTVSAAWTTLTRDNKKR
ncbi:MAG: hypothetical protein C0482_05100 [Gordonia sp.]|nr:hypothetical protein [Gordonia sp. (in: high G+C Gram-positive bacteria)]